ncbi:c-type cytochrome [Methyloversatilis thermotolerans]|uniref:c-type cytochrome n=1 Tax=Methyloversatilis thermotolerans TaxID=1346290 RepID=UPI00035E5966|nr:c-type cytochrome [Methyloversatilis thermotolerans]
MRHLTALGFALTLTFASASVLASDEKAAPKADPAAGKAIAGQVCAACHNADGNSIIPANPKLAGQHPEYIAKQLHNFQAKDGKQPERVNSIMNGMAAGLSDQDIRNLAAYYTSQKPTGGEAKGARESVDLGQKIWRAGNLSKGLPACAGCHGPAGAGLPAPYPRIAGQHADYTEAQLKAFRAGERANDPAKMMRMIAAKMSDAEIKAVADYAAGLH